MCWNIATAFRQQKRRGVQYEMCKLYSDDALENHTGELTIADQNQRIAEYLAEHKEFDLQKKYSDRKGAENASAAFDK